MKFLLLLLSACYCITIITPLPFQFPDGQQQRRYNQPSEGRANTKPNANYNRLILNRITVQQNDDDIEDYDDTVVQPDNAPVSNTSPSTTTASNSVNNNVVNDDYELSDQENDGVQSDGLRRRRKKPFCIPYQVPYPSGYFRDSNGKDGKTFWDINIVNQEYNLNSGYPHYGGGIGYGDQGTKPQTDVQHSPIHNQHNQYSGYGCIPIYYGNHHNINRPHHRPPGSHFGNRPGGGFGSFGNRPGFGSFGNRPGGIFDAANRPQGGPFGFFGPGGLFDLSNIFGGGGGGGGVGSSGSGNGDNSLSNNNYQPVSSITNNRPTVTNIPSTSSNQEIFSDSVSDDSIKPVIEINVPDTIQDLTNNLRPVVGGIANQVTGFIQQLATQPNRTFQRINRELNSYLRPVYGFF